LIQFFLTAGALRCQKKKKKEKKNGNIDLNFIEGMMTLVGDAGGHMVVRVNERIVRGTARSSQPNILTLKNMR
jgi:hypothetical protein